MIILLLTDMIDGGAATDEAQPENIDLDTPVTVNIDLDTEV